MHIKLLLLLVGIVMLLCMPVGAMAFDGESALELLYDAAPDSVTENIAQDSLSVESMMQGFDIHSVIDFLTDNLVSNISSNIGMAISVIGVLILVSIYDSLKESFAQKGTEQIADFFCAAAIAVIMCPPILDRAKELSVVIGELSDYMNLSLPVLAGLLTASGHVGSAGILHFFIYHAATLAGSLFSGLLLPLAGIYMSLGIAASVTANHSLQNLTMAIRSVTNKAMVFFCTVFTAVLSLQGVIAGAGDTLSRRTLKLAVSSFLPVAGNLMAESVDTFMSGVGVIRSVAGAFGVIVVFYVLIIPILKTVSNFLTVKLAAIVADLIGTPRIRVLLSTVADGYGMILSICAGVGIMFIICMAFLLVVGGVS